MDVGRWGEGGRTSLGSLGVDSKSWVRLEGQVEILKVVGACGSRKVKMAAKMAEFVSFAEVMADIFRLE